MTDVGAAAKLPWRGSDPDGLAEWDGSAPDLRFALALHARLAGEGARGFAWSPYSVASAWAPPRPAPAAAPETSSRRRSPRTATWTGSPPGWPPAPCSAPTDAGARLAVANTLWADLTLPLAPAYRELVKSWPGGEAAARLPRRPRGGPAGDQRGCRAEHPRADRGPARVRHRQPRHRRGDRQRPGLRASWTRPFDRAGPGRAVRTPGGAVEVPTMRTTRSLPYAAVDGWQVVSVPAGDGVLADILLPAGDLAAAEAALDADRLAALLAGPGRPRWRWTCRRSGLVAQGCWRSRWAGSGVRLLFTPEADLSGVTDGEEPLGRGRRGAQGGAYPGRGRPGGRGGDCGDDDPARRGGQPAAAGAGPGGPAVPAAGPAPAERRARHPPGRVTRAEPPRCGPRSPRRTAAMSSRGVA